ncbi:hypothetical protein NA57DRAFT_80251 [Rhizodiscina lignyota]|uniref:Uncharacterized protein n=1 Tax=Rhizodiscina lignyota TaxID=1504668 RepID=A0A9P4I6N1_9PEZI|nr:hypothetical protein NA57DRAFT_80251 [Rhizodiscina lignyota]
MIGAARDSELDSCKWANPANARADYIEAFKYANEAEVNDTNFRYGHLRDGEIGDWLEQSGRFARPAPGDAAGDLRGIIRILICERHQYSPLDFPVTRETYEALETAFNLPAATLPSFDSDAGAHSRYFEYGDTPDSPLERIGIVIKASQKREIGNFGISMSYDPLTCTTTALLYGTNVCVCDNVSVDHADGTALNRADTSQFILSPQADTAPIRNPEILNILKRAIRAWDHPLILPCAFVSYHMRRAKWFAEHGKVQNETHNIENRLGVRGDDRPQDEFWRAALNIQTTMSKDGQKGRKIAEELTLRMNRQGLRILFTERSPQWNKECSEFLKDLLDEMKDLLPAQTMNFKTSSKLREGLEYNIVAATAVSTHLANMKERMMFELDVLNSIVAQMESQLSARLAASAGRDSTSMKILAVITAFFLPATFVATLFSMSMFDWQWSDNSDDNSEPGVVSNRFWIYWATAIPLTTLTLIGWGTWWLWEIYTFDKTFSKAAGETTEVMNGVEEFKRVRSWLGIKHRNRHGSVTSADGPFAMLTKNGTAGV